MARKKKLLKIILGIVIGIIIRQFCSTSQFTFSEMCGSVEKKHLTPVELMNRENERSQNKNLLFVGVMTASKYLDSRAKAVYETWGKEIPGKILFYSSEFSSTEHVPLVALPDVDDSYPPQKKSFMMLKHMHDNFLDQYEWFLRADDDVYIKTDRLEKLLRSVDSKQPWFIGQTGRGNNEEFGLLSLDSDENFCMGGPGVILSRETLKRMAPFIEECLGHLYTTHEDVELGRCVRRFAGISCTWSYEMQVIFYHNKSGQEAFAGDLKQKEVHRAITLHPVKQLHYMYRLHKYVMGLKIQNAQHESILLHRDIAVAMRELGYRIDRIENAHLVESMPLFPRTKGEDGFLGDTKFLGIPINMNRFPVTELRDVLEWELIARTLYSHRNLNPRKRIGSSLKEGLGDVIREIMDIINSYSKQRGRVIDFKDINYGYWRLDPVHGVDLILDLLLVYRKYRGNKMTVQVRRHAYVQQTFTGIFIREVNDKEEIPENEVLDDRLPVHKKIVHQFFSKIGKKLPNFSPLFINNIHRRKTIHFILTLSGRYEIFRRFLTMYEEICLKGNEETKLYIILYKDENFSEDFIRTKYLANKIKNKYDSEINIIVANGTFNRGKALQTGVNLLKDNSLMLFIDVDIIFDKTTLYRFRKNTEMNKSLYFPIVYSMYNPALLNESYQVDDYLNFNNGKINENNGFWRDFGYGIVSLYKSDYLTLGGFNLGINGWGNEDVIFYDNAIKSNLKIVRCVDPSLIHVYHSEKCTKDLDIEQKSMCLGTQASTLGSLKTVQNLYLKNKDRLR